MNQILENIPNVHTYPLTYVLETMKLQHPPHTLWLEFGVASGKTINYISQFTQGTVYGFDSFEGLPETWRPGFEKGAFSSHGVLPPVANNVELVKGWFHETLPHFLQTHSDQKISFLHIDCDLYSSTRFILECVKDHLAPDCIVIFDELVNYPGYESGELKAWMEFITENKVDYEWIGMNGTPTGMLGYVHENVALVIHGGVSQGDFVPFGYPHPFT